MKRLTNKELAMWFAQGNGEGKLSGGMRFSSHNYYEEEQDAEVGDYIKVRKLGDEEWHEPTYEYCFGTIEEKTEEKTEESEEHLKKVADSIVITVLKTYCDEKGDLINDTPIINTYVVKNFDKEQRGNDKRATYI